ncbi:AT-rich interactive domain-containing protein 5B [Diretmus argenteus]
MEPDSPTWVGSPCGLHGPYVFYKAFRFHLDGKRRILSLGDFFVVRCRPGEPLCVAELQLLWEERTNRQLLSSSKLYFLPEDTPQGRTVNHGEDEVIAVSEKVIVRLEDLVKWTVWDPRAWSRGMKAVPLKPSTAHRDGGRTDQRDPAFLRYRDSTLSSGLNFKDVLREKAELGEDSTRVLVLSYPQYCRYRSVLARLRERPPSLLTDQVVLALGGIAALSGDARVLYCRDTFDHLTLLHNESVCDEFAPNLKGRPRKKKLSLSQRRDLQGQGQGSELKGQTSPAAKETGTTEGKSSPKVKADKAVVPKPKGGSGGSCGGSSITNGSSNVSSSSKRTPLPSSEGKRRGGGGGAEECRAEEQSFLVSLYKYMKERQTPIERIPYLGFKQINLWTMFQAAQKLGGYELITARRQWKHVYDELGGNPGSTSAATCTRRHYERLILPYERFTNGEEDKPLPQHQPRKQEAGSSTESSTGVNSHVPKTKLTNGVKQQAQKPRPETDDVIASKVQDQSTPVLLEKVFKLTVTPQILVTRLDAPRPPHSNRERRSPGEEDGKKGKEIQLKEEVEEAEERRKGECDPSYSPAPPMAKDDKSAFPLATPKVLNHAHPAVDLWQQEQTAVKDQCHVGMVSPTLKHRALQSLAVPDPPGEPVDHPKKEDPFLGFTSLLYPTRVNLGIMSPLAKKKLLSQVSGTGLPNHNHFPSPLGAPPPLINSGLTNGVPEEPAGQPVAAADSSVTVISRPSVIQHVQSFKSWGAEGTTEGGQRERVMERGGKATSPLHSHEHHLPRLPHASVPHSHPEEPYHQRPSPPLLAPERPCPGRTPPGFLGDLYSSSSHLRSLYRKAESHLSQEPGQELQQIHGLSDVAPTESKQQHQQKGLSFPAKLVDVESKQYHQQQHGLRFSSDLAHNEAKWRQRGLHLPRDTDNSCFRHSHHHDSNYSTHVDQQNKSSINTSSDHPRTAAATDDQPTDLSLPKSSPLKMLPHPSSSSSSRPLTRDDASSPTLFHNGHRAISLAYQPRACRVPPMTFSAMHTQTPRPDPATSDPHPRVNGHGEEGRRAEGHRGGMGAQRGERERTEAAAELYNKMDDHAIRPILGSKVTPQNICTTRPLKRPLEEPENGAPERKIRAVTPMHASSSLSLSSSSSSFTPKDVVVSSFTPEELDDGAARAADVQKSPPVMLSETVRTPHMHMGASFVEGGVATPLPLLPTSTTPHIYPTALYPAGVFSLSQVQDLCRDTLRTPLTTGYPPSSHSHPHYPLQYLKNQSAAVLSPLVPPFAIHSFMMQRQLLAQAAASPTHMYRHPVAAASYGDLLQHGLYPMSLNPQPAFNPPPLSPVHPSTKLS